MFVTEKVPEGWVKGLIQPLFKEGDVNDVSNYRGITLLSIVGKIYASVLNARLVRWCESRNILVDEQNGFRSGRRTTGHMFVLSEVIRMRRKKGLPTFCAFIDLRKAYDRVMRSGLWLKLWSYGIRGRMFRVLHGMYQNVWSAVLVDGGLSQWFSLNIGLRQGCVLSPLLFDLFINGVAEELKQQGLGVSVMDSKLSILMFADDIVLMASSEQELQKMLDVVGVYCSKWRCDVNAKKTEVVPFGASECTFQWCINGQQLKVVDNYKYLGLDVYVSMRWTQMQNRLYAKARAKVATAFGMANCAELLNVEFGINIWQTLIRPVLEYGVEIWGDEEWNEGEALQRKVAKRILKC
jgi:hypothetical protein